MRSTSIVVKRTGAHLWEPLTRGNPSLALRVSDDSSATPTWEEVVAYIIT